MKHSGSSSPCARVSLPATPTGSAGLDEVGFTSIRRDSRSFKDVAKAFKNAAGGVAEMKRMYKNSMARTVSIDEEAAAVSYLRFTPSLLHSQLCSPHVISASNMHINQLLSDTLAMALLLIDISGFTRLSVTLGAETTRKYISKFFGELISEIKRHGGDVLKFLGDALLVAWPAALSSGQDVRQHIAKTAAKCAADIMKNHNNFIVDSDLVLTLHGAIAFGVVHTFDVGNSERREFLIGGEVLAELGHMEAEATSGKLVASKEFFDLLPEGSVCENLPSGHVRLVEVADGSRNGKSASVASTHPMPPLADKELAKFALKCKTQLSRHVPVSCREPAESGALDVLGEMRWVTTLFLTVDYLIPYLNSGEGEPVQSAFVLVDEAAQATGGEIRQFVLDDKGCVAIVAWGLPDVAHGQERDAEKAVSCALHLMICLKAMQQSGAKMQPGPHIGIAAGEVYVGLVGAEERCEYAMVGPSVNLAARLMGKAAPWHVLLEESTRVKAQAAGASFDFQERGAVKAKGYDDEVKVFEPVFNEITSLQSSHREEVRRNLVEQWDMLTLNFQFVGKVASVLAETPTGGSSDFRLRALIGVLEKLNIGRPEATIDAVTNLRAVHILRLTRGAFRGNPAYGFQSKEVREFLAGLLPIEMSSKVHFLYANWLEQDISDLEKQDTSDARAKLAALTMLHHDVDAKLAYHRELGKPADTSEHCSTGLQDSQQSWVTQKLFSYFACCISRENKVDVAQKQ